MEKMGWSKGKGLGADEKGIVERSLPPKNSGGNNQVYCGLLLYRINFTNVGWRNYLMNTATEYGICHLY